MSPANLQVAQFEASFDPLQANLADQAGWMITYLDVFILTAALFATLLTMKPDGAPATLTLDGRPLPAAVEVLQRQDGQAELSIGSAVLFPPSGAELQNQGQRLIDQIIPLIQDTQGLVFIEGHTDSLPIATAAYPSNWELASDRAMNVLHYLVAQGVERERLRIISYADTQPRAPNDSEANRQRNRRVSIVLQPTG